MDAGEPKRESRLDLPAPLEKAAGCECTRAGIRRESGDPDGEDAGAGAFGESWPQVHSEISHRQLMWQPQTVLWESQHVPVVAVFSEQHPERGQWTAGGDPSGSPGAQSPSSPQGHGDETGPRRTISAKKRVPIRSFIARFSLPSRGDLVKVFPIVDRPSDPATSPIIPLHNVERDFLLPLSMTWRGGWGGEVWRVHRIAWFFP
jgi:hypothetical protein